MSCLELFYKFCKNNNYTGNLKFNTVVGELYIQVRYKKIFIDQDFN
jgi:hypothetical protein